MCGAIRRGAAVKIEPMHEYWPPAVDLHRVCAGLGAGELLNDERRDEFEPSSEMAGHMRSGSSTKARRAGRSRRALGD